MMPWQTKILVDIESGGLKPGEMYFMMAGRNIGKSTIMDLQEQILQEKAKEISDHMDFMVLADFLTADGWTMISIRYFPSQPRKDIVDWVKQTCHGKWKESCGTWLFETPKDATSFALKWA